MLNESEIRSFWEDGFLIVPEVFSDEDVAALIRATEDPAIQQDLEVRRANERIAHLLELTTKHLAFKELARDRRLTARVARLIGDDIQLQHSKLATKPRQTGAGEFPWHQDFARFPHTNYDLVAVSVMLDDATPDNGGMYALKGSHQLGLRNHVRDGWMIGPCYESHLWETAPEKVVPMMAAAGAVIIHHCLLLHTSPATHTGMQRRMIALEYRAGHAYQLANNVWADTGFQVHGTAGGRVKCVPMDLELPRDPLWLRYCGEACGNVFNQVGPVARQWNAEPNAVAREPQVAGKTSGDATTSTGPTPQK